MKVKTFLVLVASVSFLVFAVALIVKSHHNQTPKTNLEQVFDKYDRHIDVLGPLTVSPNQTHSYLLGYEDAQQGKLVTIDSSVDEAFYLLGYEDGK